MPSCSASSISQGDAFITRRGERTVTFTSMPPSRSAVRQQSMAVLPPPITTTRLPTVCTCSKATEVSQSMPMWMLACRFLATGDVEVLALGRAGADEDGVEAFLQQRVEALDLLAEARLDAHASDAVDLLVEHASRAGGRRECWCASGRRPCGSFSNSTHVIAERQQIARNGERGGAGADQGDALAVLRAGMSGMKASISPL